MLDPAPPLGQISRMGRTGRTGDKSVTGLLVQAPIRSDPSGRCAPQRCTRTGRQIERRTPWSYLGRGQTGPVQHHSRFFTDLAVLPGAVRSDELLGDAVGGAELAQGPPVGPGVVGHQTLDGGDAVSGEVADGAGQERL